MAIYTVHLPPDGKGENARFVREGVSLLALFLPLVWLVWHRLWLALMVYIAIVVAIIAVAAEVSQTLAGFLSLLPGLFYFVEGNELVRNRMRRTGWRMAGVIEAASGRDAELRFFSEWLRPGPSAPVAVPARPVPVHSSIGMFPE